MPSSFPAAPVMAPGALVPRLVWLDPRQYAVGQVSVPIMSRGFQSPSLTWGGGIHFLIKLPLFVLARVQVCKHHGGDTPVSISGIHLA